MTTSPRRLVTPERRDEDADASLRPQRLSEFVGQAQARANLSVFIEAARSRKEALDHVLFVGPPGLGKTTLAQIVSRELGVNFRATSGPVIAKAGDLAALLTNLEDRDVLFIDEIHRLNPAVEEILYPAMEDFQLDLIIGEGPAARSVKIDLARFTLVGATTRAGLLTTPLRDPQTGLVTCLYKGFPDAGFWSELGAMHINFWFLPGALVAEVLGVGGGCFGATIALRRETLELIGGFTRLRDELADDHRIGDEVRALGLAVVLSPYIVEARVTEPSFAAVWRHELRWARTERAVAPVGFIASVLSHSVAVAALGAAVTGFALTSSLFLVISCVLRWGSARVIADALGLRPAKASLLAVRDVLSFAVYVASFFGRRVVWRDEAFRVEASGRMTVEGDKAP